MIRILRITLFRLPRHINALCLCLRCQQIPQLDRLSQLRGIHLTWCRFTIQKYGESRKCLA